MHAFTRPRRTTILCGLAGSVAALGFGAVTAATTSGAAAKSPTKITCVLRTTDAAPTAQNAEDFGTLSCSPLLGRGVQHNRGRLRPTSPTTGTVTGTSKLFFDTGTVRASFRLRYEVSGPKIAYTGTARITGGTGTYKRIAGHAVLNGSSNDGGTHSTITETVTRTR